MSFIVSFGEWGGFCLKKGYCKRICLGWVSFTIFPMDFDQLMYAREMRSRELLDDYGL